MAICQKSSHSAIIEFSPTSEMTDFNSSHKQCNLYVPSVTLHSCHFLNMHYFPGFTLVQWLSLICVLTVLTKHDPLVVDGVKKKKKRHMWQYGQCWEINNQFAAGSDLYFTKIQHWSSLMSCFLLSLIVIDINFGVGGGELTCKKKKKKVVRTTDLIQLVWQPCPWMTLHVTTVMVYLNECKLTVTPLLFLSVTSDSALSGPWSLFISDLIPLGRLFCNAIPSRYCCEMCLCGHCHNGKQANKHVTKLNYNLQSPVLKLPVNAAFRFFFF